MQPLLVAGRGPDSLTEAQVLANINSSALLVSSGLELLDQDLTVLADISDSLESGSVSRDNTATIHGACSLKIAGALDWGSAIVRPYMTLTDDFGRTLRYNLGAYYTSTPVHDPSTSPVIYDVTGYDLLEALSSPVGSAYSVDKGSAYLDAVVQILADQGFSQVLLDPDRATTTLTSARVWPLDENITWLTVINDLLNAVGYEGIWADWDGVLRARAYQVPTMRTPEWVYDTGDNTSLLSTKRTVTRDFFDAPNRWVFVRSNEPDGTTPVDGNGIYTFINQSDGPTSVDARGRVISTVVPTEAADQDALVASASQTIAEQQRIDVKVVASTAPNPLHWHQDRILLSDPAIGEDIDVLETSWSLPLDGSDMDHAWKGL